MTGCNQVYCMLCTWNEIQAIYLLYYLLRYLSYRSHLIRFYGISHLNGVIVCLNGTIRLLQNAICVLKSCNIQDLGVAFGNEGRRYETWGKLEAPRVISIKFHFWRGSQHRIDLCTDHASKSQQRGNKGWKFSLGTFISTLSHLIRSLLLPQFQSTSALQICFTSLSSSILSMFPYHLVTNRTIHLNYLLQTASCSRANIQL